MPLHFFPYFPPRSPDSRDGYVYPPPAQVFCDLAIMQTEVDHYLSRENKKVHSLHWISTSSLEWFNVKLLSIFWQALGWLIELSPVTLVVLVSIVTLLRGLHQGQDVAFLKTGTLLCPAKEWSPRSRPLSIYFAATSIPT